MKLEFTYEVTGDPKVTKNLYRYWDFKLYSNNHRISKEYNGKFQISILYTYRIIKR